jgi:alpha-beta hydrolase superfamily lysophospholipase
LALDETRELNRYAGPSQMNEFGFKASDVELRCFRWQPTGPPRAAVLVAHGMGEHAARYERLGNRLAEHGYLVIADDHRGHGATADPDRLGDIGTDGWNRMVTDLFALNAHLRTLAPGAPRVLLGHSMGAMLAQQYLCHHGDTLDAAVLSGSPGLGTAFALWLSHTIARFERMRLGADAASPLMQRLLFGSANDPFKGPTGFEWLSRDADEVARYVADPKCGFVLRVGGLCDLFAGSRATRKPAAIAGIPKQLPLYVLSGTDDPVHDGGKGLDRLVGGYRRAGMMNVTERRYPGGRHEMFNETNRDEVERELIDWLDRTLASLGH